MPSDFHQRLAAEAKRRSLSLNRLSLDLIEKGMKAGRQKDSQNGRILSPYLKRLRKHFGDSLEGVVLFGSQARNEAHQVSDWDLLIVLSASAVVGRDLYRWWDEAFSQKKGDQVVSPHFVSLPEKVGSLGGLWYEVALSSEILFDREGGVDFFLKEVRKEIEEDSVRRYWSHGHPYWVVRKKPTVSQGDHFAK